MGEVIPYEVFRGKRMAKLRKKLADKNFHRSTAQITAELKAMNLPDDFNPFQDEADEYHRLCYGEDESEEEDFWLGEKSLCQVIQPI